MGEFTEGAPVEYEEDEAAPNTPTYIGTSTLDIKILDLMGEAVNTVRGRVMGILKSEEKQRSDDAEVKGQLEGVIADEDMAGVGSNYHDEVQEEARTGLTHVRTGLAGILMSEASGQSWFHRTGQNWPHTYSIYTLASTIYTYIHVYLLPSASAWPDTIYGNLEHPGYWFYVQSD
ncbi:hypothetical protein BDR04DRAFT_1121014 [Suillus decipiens]|nr:hypothetical protein BDR04DRAFT_1121014 [Suillus decipiens]